MKSLLTVVGFLLCPCVCLGWSGECVRVMDGDTIAVMHEGRAEKIRLYGIDCPERRQDFSHRATQFTSAMVFRRTVEVSLVTKDRYRRTVAWISVGGRSLNKKLVRAGLAWWFRRYAPRNEELRGLETEARADRRGLWADPNPVPPWEFRRKRRSNP